MRFYCLRQLQAEESLKECGECEAARGEGAFKRSEAVSREGDSPKEFGECEAFRGEGAS